MTINKKGGLHTFVAHKFLYRHVNGVRTSLLPAVKISAIGIALGVALILLSLFVVAGFKNEIRGSINGFAGNIRLYHPDNSYQQYSHPLPLSSGFLDSLHSECAPLVTPTVSAFADQMGVIKTDSAFKGAVLHGVDSLYHRRRFISDRVVEGSLPVWGGEQQSNEVLISSTLARQLQLSTDSTLMIYFVNGGAVKARKLHIKGLYATGVKEYDDKVILADLRLVQGVLGWSSHEVGGVEVSFPEHHNNRLVYDRLYNYLTPRVEKQGERYAMLTAEDMYPVMFGWLDFLDTNIAIILLLMIVVAAMTMITGIIIIILEKVSAISTLKALGQSNASLRRVFHHVALQVLLRGIVGGNIAAIAIGAVQYFFHPLRLDAAQYYIDHVPIYFSWGSLLLTDVAAFLLLYVVIYIPTSIVSNISPAAGIRFE